MKTLYQQVEEEEAALKAASSEEVEKEEKKPEEVKPDDDDKPATDGGEDEKAPVEDPEEKPVVKEPVKEERPPENADFAAMRYQLAQTRRELDELKKPKEQPKPEPQVVQDPEPDKDDVEAHLSWQLRENKRELADLRQKTEPLFERQAKQDQLTQEQEFMQNQIRGFNVAEQQFRANVPDYDEAADHMLGRMKESVKNLYPNATAEQVSAFAAKQLLGWAESFAQAGRQPAEALYNMAKSHYGYAKAEEVKKSSKPDLSTIDKNRKKSANGLGGSGGKSTITAQAVAEMTVAEMAAMEKEQPGEIDRLMRNS